MGTCSVTARRRKGDGRRGIDCALRRVMYAAFSPQFQNIAAEGVDEDRVVLRCDVVGVSRRLTVISPPPFLGSIGRAVNMSSRLWVPVHEDMKTRLERLALDAFRHAGRPMDVATLAHASGSASRTPDLIPMLVTFARHREEAAVDRRLQRLFERSASPDWTKPEKNLTGNHFTKGTS
jgi:hypothetical protein